MDEGAERVLQRLRRADGGDELGVEERRLALVDRGQQLLAVGEVLVHEGTADPSALGHRLHRDGLDVASGDQRRRRVEQRVPPVGPRQPDGVDALGRRLYGRFRRFCTHVGHGVILSPTGDIMSQRPAGRWEAGLTWGGHP